MSSKPTVQYWQEVTGDNSTYHACVFDVPGVHFSVGVSSLEMLAKLVGPLRDFGPKALNRPLVDGPNRKPLEPQDLAYLVNVLKK